MPYVSMVLVDYAPKHQNFGKRGSKHLRHKAFQDLQLANSGFITGDWMVSTQPMQPGHTSPQIILIIPESTLVLIKFSLFSS